MRLEIFSVLFACIVMVIHDENFVLPLHDLTLPPYIRHIHRFCLMTTGDEDRCIHPLFIASPHSDDPHEP
jgi:hypothetical protein